MSEIKIEKKPSAEQLALMNVKTWPIWTKEKSEFPWTYDADETCYILAGKVEVTPIGGEPVTVCAGDLVTFPKGMSCTWKVIEPIRKHYNFSD